MFYPHTERQARFIAIAHQLAAQFVPRAAAHDRAGSFPHENYADLRAAGLPALIVPAAWGGWAASLLETVLTMEALAVGDGSVALNAVMHMQTLGDALENQSWPPALLERICRAAVTRGALINSVASEPELGSPSRGGKPKTTATPTTRPGPQGAETGYLLNGHKIFGSGSPTLDYMIMPALVDDGSQEVGRFLVQPGPGVEIAPTWDALGLRSTGSHDVYLHNVFVPSELLIGRGTTNLSVAKVTQGAKTNAWFMLGVGAVYVGIALAAQQTAARYALERIPTALGKPIAEVENIQRHLGQAELLLQQARAQLYFYADLWDRHPAEQLRLSPGVNAAKVIATNHAIAAVDHCMRVAGGAGMTKALPLERYYRDVRGGLLHPMNDDALLVMLGKQVVELARAR